MSTLADPRVDTPTTAHGRALDAEPADLRLLFRWLTAMLFIVAAFAANMWTSMAVRHTAVELDAARSALTRAEIRHERLLVERSLLRDPGRLHETAGALSLVPPVATVTLTEVAAE